MPQPPWQSSGGALFQLPFVVPEEDDAGHGEANDTYQKEQAQRSGEELDRSAEQVRADAEHHRPGDAAKRIHENEMPPWHAVGSGQDRREGAQQGDVTAEEHDLAAVP